MKIELGQNGDEIRMRLGCDQGEIMKKDEDWVEMRLRQNLGWVTMRQDEIKTRFL